MEHMWMFQRLLKPPSLLILGRGRESGFILHTQHVIGVAFPPDGMLVWEPCCQIICDPPLLRSAGSDDNITATRRLIGREELRLCLISTDFVYFLGKE